MKKVISILILLVMICTVCIGFVGCGNNPKTRLEIGELNEFLVAKEDFSFGKVVVDTEGLVVTDPRIFELIDPGCISYPFRPQEHEIYLESNDALIDTVNAMQLIFDKYKPTNLSGIDEEEYDMYIYYQLIAQKTHFRINAYFGNENRDYSDECFGDIVDMYHQNQEGSYLVVYNPNSNRGEDEWRIDSEISQLAQFSKDMVHEIYSVGDYKCTYVSAMGVYSPFHKNTNYNGEVLQVQTLSFYTLIYKEGWESFDKLEFVLKINLGNWFKRFQSIMCVSATPEEQAQIASYYQSIQKEMLTAWLESEQATAYYSENFETKE